MYLSIGKYHAPIVQKWPPIQLKNLTGFLEFSLGHPSVSIDLVLIYLLYDPE